MPRSRPLGGEKAAPEREDVPVPDAAGPALGVVVLPHIFLCSFQSAFWHSREQYGVEEHFPHRLMFAWSEVFLQMLQARVILMDV